jgi:hypothetical protein
MLSIEDFRANIDRSGDCWPWTGGHATTQGGYVRLSWACLPDPYVHRAAWILERGPIPPGMTIDHSCRDQPTCCRVEHMEVVTQGENTRRAHKGTCRNGHPMTMESTVSNGARRLCRECRREYRRNRRRQQDRP